MITLQGKSIGRKRVEGNIEDRERKKSEKKFDGRHVEGRARIMNVTSLFGQSGGKRKRRGKTNVSVK
jgi:hypothetical protein